MTPQRFIKTLVVGLGSTGTEICDLVAERIRWELDDDLARAPWVRFLAIETNAGLNTSFTRTGDFLPLSLSQAQFQQMLVNPAPYTERIGLQDWWDPATVAVLPGQDVSAGAGNIRMVGRLAFLHEPNFNLVRTRLTDRIEDLNRLTAAAAADKRGSLHDGTTPPIEFAFDGQVRVIVVGTLCGGTCSGTLSDFGYLIRQLLSQGEGTMGIFTLPHPQFRGDKWERLQRNAYHALLELNHYSLAGREDPPLRFPDGPVETGTFPYSLPYLAVPHSQDDEGRRELSGAIADRIFLNIFTPEVDPFASGVDAAVHGATGDGSARRAGQTPGVNVRVTTDLFNRAHVFCAFGLSTIEYPVRQITEACSARLLAFALERWNGRSQDPVVMERRVRDAGFTWDNLLAALSRLPSGDSLASHLLQKREEVYRLAASKPAEAQKSLDELRAAFIEQPGGTEGEPLARGGVHRTFQSNRARAAEEIVGRIRLSADQWLRDYQDGPAPFLDFLKGAGAFFTQLAARKPAGADPERVNTLLRRIAEYRRSLLLLATGIRGRVVDHHRQQLREALRKEIDARQNTVALACLGPGQPVAGIPSPGTLEVASRLLEDTRQRTNRFRERITHAVELLQARAKSLAQRAPRVNGYCLFEPETAQGGSVLAEYQEALRRLTGSDTGDYLHGQEKAAADVIREWEGLASLLAPDPALAPDGWLMQPYNTRALDSIIQPARLAPLQRAARIPFSRLANEDVLERLAAEGHGELPDGRIAAALGAADPLLQVDETLGRRFGRSPIQRVASVLAPESPHRGAFLALTRKLSQRPRKEALSPDHFRLVILEDWYRFPLSACPQLLAALGAAECHDWPNFHTRADIRWVGLSDAEVEAQHRAQRLLTLAILLGIVKPHGGALAYDYTKTHAADPGVRRLPFKLRDAAQAIARGENDAAGHSLAGTADYLDLQIKAHRRTAADDDAFVAHLEERLQAGVGNPVPGWDPIEAARQIQAFCAGDKALFEAYNRRYPPDPALIASLRKEVGETVNGLRVEEAGLYCTTCGGLVGRDEQDAATTAWRCRVNPDHDFRPR